MPRATLKKAAPVAKHPPDIGIGKLLRSAHMSFSREFRIRLAMHDVTFGEFVHLERLWDEDGLNQTELSRRVGIETASSTKIIETLEKRKFIRRERNSRDRRNINVFLTPRGATLKPDLIASAKKTNLIARTGLSDDDTQILFDLLGRIVQNLDAAADRTPNGRQPVRAVKSAPSPKPPALRRSQERT